MASMIRYLKNEQRKALKENDFKTLNEVNKKLYDIRAKARQEYLQEKERKRDERFAKHIEDQLSM